MVKLPPLINETTGLAYPPAPLDCLEECRFASKQACFVDRHRLYFSRAIYEANGPNSPENKLRSDPFNIVPLPRCQHEKFHKNYDGPEIPDPEVIDAFLQESDLLRKLGVTAINLACLELEVDPTKFRPLKLMHIARHRRSFERRHNNLTETIEELKPRLEVVEIIPVQVIIDPFRHLYRKAPQEVKSRARQLIA